MLLHLPLLAAAQILVAYDARCPSWSDTRSALKAAVARAREVGGKGGGTELRLIDLASRPPAPELALLESTLVAHGSPAIAHLDDAQQLSRYRGALDDTAALAAWMLELREASSGMAWLRRYLVEGIPLLQRGLEQEIERRGQLSFLGQVGRFARECARLSKTAAALPTLHNRSLAAPHNSSQALWALQENLAHARSDLHAAAVGEGDPTGERQRDALRAARLRLRAARTVLTAATAASAAAAEEAPPEEPTALVDEDGSPIDEGGANFDTAVLERIAKVAAALGLEHGAVDPIRRANEAMGLSPHPSTSQTDQLAVQVALLWPGAR